MKEQFCSPQISLILKELGFDEPCIAYWRNDDIILYSSKPEITQKVIFDNYGGIKAPLWQQCIGWFREKYNYHIDITFREVNGNRIEGINSVYFDIEIYHLRGGDAYKVYKYSEISDDYYYARKEAILKAIELCKK